MIFKIQTLFAVILLLSIQNLFGLTIQTIDYYTGMTYNSNAGVSMERTITVAHSGEATSYFLTFSSGSSGDSFARTSFSWSHSDLLSYYLYDNSTDKNILLNLSDSPSAGQVLSGSFGASAVMQYENNTFSIVVPPDMFPRSGDYSDTITISLYSGTLSSYTFVASVNVQYAFRVQEVMELSIVNSSEPFNSTNTSLNFSFGILYTGETRTGDIIVRSTNPYTLQLKSANQGSMKRTDIWDPKGIPYSCYVDNTLIDLSTYEAATAASGTSTDADGSRHEIKVIIGDFWDITAGDFEDVITVTLAAQW